MHHFTDTRYDEGVVVKEKNPYVNKLSLKQIANAHDNHFYIQVGSDTVMMNGKQTFNKEIAEMLFEEVVENMRAMLESKDMVDRQLAMECLTCVHIHKMRFH